MALADFLATEAGQTVLIFVLVFVVIFAILQRTKILGDGKKQIDALVALVIGLLVTTVGYVMNIIQKLIPFLAVTLVIILVLLLLLGSFWVSESFKVTSGIKIAGGILVTIALAVALISITGVWGYIAEFFSNQQSLVTNVFLIAVVIAVVVLTAWFGGDSDRSGTDKKSSSG